MSTDLGSSLGGCCLYWGPSPAVRGQRWAGKSRPWWSLGGSDDRSRRGALGRRCAGLSCPRGRGSCLLEAVEQGTGRECKEQGIRREAVEQGIRREYEEQGIRREYEEQGIRRECKG